MLLTKCEVLFISVWKDTRLIGFGRATSDKIYRAVLWDVVVEKSHQKIGIGKKIVKMNPFFERELSYFFSHFGVGACRSYRFPFIFVFVSWLAD